MDAKVHPPRPFAGRTDRYFQKGSAMIEKLAPAPRAAGFVTGAPRLLLRLEALAALAGLAAWYQTASGDWMLFALLFLIPDLSMVGYLAGPRIGAVCYNAAHSLIGPIVLGAAAQIWPELLPCALIWGAHVAFDRALGYGLKHGSAFGDTHLGLVGRRRPRAAAMA